MTIKWDTQSLYHGIAESPYITDCWKTPINEHADNQHEQARADPESFARGSSSDIFSYFIVTNLSRGEGAHLLLDEVRACMPKGTQYTTYNGPS